MTATPTSGLANLLSTVATGGNGTGPAIFWNGGPGLLTVTGTFGGATVTLNYCTDGTNWVAAGAAATISGASTPPNGIAYLPRCAVQAVISGGGGSTALIASFQPINEGGA